MGEKQITTRMEWKEDGTPRFMVIDVEENIIAEASTEKEIEQCSNALKHAGWSSERIANIEQQARDLLKTQPIFAPPGWREDELSRFLAMAQKNVRISFYEYPDRYALLSEIDALLFQIIDNVDEETIASFFLSRARATFMTACGLAMSRQFPESYSMIRSCLENSLYGLEVGKNPTSGDIWLNRHKNETAMKASKKIFRLSAQVKAGDPLPLFDLLGSEDASLRTMVEELYDFSIDLGAHPNVHSVIWNLTSDEREGQPGFMVNYLNPDPNAMSLCCLSLTQAGIYALRIFSYIFPQRYAYGNVDKRVEELFKIIAKQWKPKAKFYETDNSTSS